MESNTEKSRNVYTGDATTATTSFNKTETLSMSNDFTTDPFKNSKEDPFMEDDFSKATIDPFEFSYSPKHSTVLPDTKITSDTESAKSKIFEETSNVFNGPLQVNLPPESWNTQVNLKKLERQSSETSSPTIPTAMSAARNRPSVFKQNTVDVISSISSKKMKPHIFSQKFSKRDSNSINMRRLQESDSLSENETAPEPPPRPESASHIEPPPLPPKKQFSDIIIRPSPRSTSSSSSNIRESPRYDFISSKLMKNQQNDNAPPLPLPSRKVCKSDSTYPGPARPAKKSNEEDYLTPISLNDLPILLPPPQQKTGTKTRQNRKIDSIDSVKSEPETKHELSESPIPDTLLAELAKKLNVPASKLSEMSAVEFIAVTAQVSSLSDIIEISKKQSEQQSTPEPPPKEDPNGPNTAVFKVNFDQGMDDATFVAKFDDSFGEDQGFVANFDNFNQKANQPTTPVVQPTTDRYAVFREIIDQEINNSSLEVETFETPIGSLTMTEDDIHKLEEDEKKLDHSPITVPITKIDTKITEVISQAKDRYAALRDIVLVEDLFEKPLPPIQSSPNLLDTMITSEEDIVNIPELRNSNGDSPEITIEPDTSTYNQDDDMRIDSEVVHVTNILATKDDLEIDEYMNRAISNLSLDSRDHLSPIINNTTKTPIPQSQNASTSPICLQTKSPLPAANVSDLIQKATLNDMSTSPIPATKSPIQRSPQSKSPASKSPLPQTSVNTKHDIIDNEKVKDILSDGIGGSSPEDTGI